MMQRSAAYMHQPYYIQVCVDGQREKQDAAEKPNNNAKVKKEKDIRKNDVRKKK